MTTVIGAGYLGQRFLQEFIPSKGSTLDPPPNSGLIPFNLSDPDFSKLEPSKQLIISCSVETLGDNAKDFAQYAKETFERVVLISSASLFQVSCPNQIITEDCPLKDCSRVKAESHFLPFSHILNCGLLWDTKERPPKRWLTQGRIKNGRKLINFTNADTLPAICKKIFESDMPYGRYICTDSVAKSWQEIADFYEMKLPSAAPDLRSKKLSNIKLISYLGTNLFIPPS